MANKQNVRFTDSEKSVRAFSTTSSSDTLSQMQAPSCSAVPLVEQAPSCLPCPRNDQLRFEMDYPPFFLLVGLRLIESGQALIWMSLCVRNACPQILACEQAGTTTIRPDPPRMTKMDQPIFHRPPTMTSNPNAFHSARRRLGFCPLARLLLHSSAHALCSMHRQRVDMGDETRQDTRTFAWQ